VYIALLKRYYLEHVLVEQTKQQVEEMRAGIGEVVSVQGIEVFLPEEIRMLLWTECDWTQEDLEK
jgi:hypothetical protein